MNLLRRIERLEARAPAWSPVQAFLLGEHEPLPPGVDEGDSAIMVIRLIGVTTEIAA